MEPKFTIDRNKISDDEIESRKDFDALVKKFKEQSIQDAKSQKRFPKIRKLVYTTVIAGFLVVCTVTVNEITKNNEHDKTATSIANSKTTLTDKEKSKFIQPVKKETKLAYSKYTVNANKGGVITHKTTSQITVPKAAFVKKDGKEVTGNVEIHYREMHDVVDQLVSGIPMRYDSAGVKHDFESAGMIDIKGFHEGEEVFIKPGKNLDINMVSRKDGTRFNLYYLDTVAKKWDYLGKDKVVSITETAENKALHTELKKDQTSKEVKEIETTIQKLAVQKGELIASTDKKIITLPTPVEPQKPAVANKARKQFKLDVNYEQFPELKAFKGCLFEVGEENTHYTKEFSTITWADAYITPGSEKGKYYILNLELAHRKEKLIVYPVFTGTKLEEVQDAYSKKFTEYEKSLTERKAKEKKYKEDLEKDLKKIEEEQKLWVAKMEAEKKKISEQAIVDLQAAKNSGELDFKVRRLFQVNNFGVYNTDCAQRMGNSTITSAVFATDKNYLRPNMIYLIDNKANMMITYTSADLENFKYDAKKEYSILTSVNNELYLCNAESFQNSKKDGDKTIFNFTPLDLELFDADELRKKLGV
ncbi:MAG: hypothetical protein K0S33_50 [Bacteroidetes bacterium]|jgi:hypothetical protein|nr:hypothetical protein [Bacteroidota bacterium]